MNWTRPLERSSEAKSGARTAQTALETMYTDDQSYANGSVANLIKIEPALTQLGTRLTTTPGPDTYVVNVQSKGSNGITYKISRDNTGAVTRTCDITFIEVGVAIAVSRRCIA